MLTYNPKVTTDLDPLFPQAAKLVQETGKASASLIQRQFKLGYARSARLIDELEQEGLVGPSKGAEPREVFLAPKEIAEETQSKWKKSPYAKGKTKTFQIPLGHDNKLKYVDLNLDRYGNLLVIGSQFTSAVILLNNILATSLTTYSPEELQLLVIDGVRGDLTVPNTASHLLTPVIVEPEKAISALKWSVAEIDRRSKSGNNKKSPKVLIVINSLNQILNFAPSDTEDFLYRIIVQGRKFGFHLILCTDYPNPRTSKQIMANIPAKLVFKPTDKKIARETGIPESIDLVSPDEAILETMFEGRKKLTVDKVDTKKVYEDIFS